MCPGHMGVLGMVMPQSVRTTHQSSSFVAGGRGRWMRLLCDPWLLGGVSVLGPSSARVAS